MRRCYTFLFIHAALGITCVSSDKNSLLVRTTSGDVRGYKDSDGDIFAFYGIPYATAPTGSDRFKAPLPPPVWLQPLDAVDSGKICPQAMFISAMLSNTTMQENCLVANIFVPDIDDKNLPVVVLVHGGAFQVGYGSAMKVKQLMKAKKFIVVSFNYRLGVHGFLCLGTKDVPGNAGMKDQVALLRWVQRNIANFGGNPDDVTISGASAGSAAVDLLLLSKTTRGLFNKVIAESGSHLAAFTVQRDPLANAKYFAKRLDSTINVDDVYALEKLYKTVSYERLTMDNFLDRTDSTFLFSPCVERDMGEEIFLADDPANIIESGEYIKVPLLYSFANMEGLFRINLFESWKIKMNENFTEFLPDDLQFDSINEREKIVKQVKEFYFGNKPVGNENILSYVNYFTDVIFAYSTLRSVRMQVEGGHDKIYLYEYSFVDDNDPVVPYAEVRGANHCAQTAAVFDTNILMENAPVSEELRKMKFIVRELWTNFITTGTPAPEGSSLPAWPPVGANWSPHMSLGQTVELKGSLLEQRTRFWDSIYERHYRPAVPPPAPPVTHSEF